MSLTKGQIHKLKGKLSRVPPGSSKAKRIRIQLGLETAPVVEAAPVVEVAEVVVEAAAAVEVVEAVVEKPASAPMTGPKAKRLFRRNKAGAIKATEKAPAKKAVAKKAAAKKTIKAKE